MSLREVAGPVRRQPATTEAYRDVSRVVDVMLRAGISRKVASSQPRESS
ncbi:MAG: hypothetical protein GF355_07885 [Candidatus Eisenbacteria bacterium]|nr:hypothetical protein [Candidatus Eisenbacteria bacterium]